MLEQLSQEVKECAEFLDLQVTNLEVRNWGDGVTGTCKVHGTIVNLPNISESCEMRAVVVGLFARLSLIWKN